MNDAEVRRRCESLQRHLMKHRERYVRAWVAWSGVPVGEAVLVSETTTIGRTITTRCWVERKGDRL